MGIEYYGLAEGKKKWKYHANSCMCSIIRVARLMAGIPPHRSYRVSAERCLADAALLAALSDEQIDTIRDDPLVSDCVLPGESIVPDVREWQGFLEACGGYVTDQDWIPPERRAREWQDWKER
jgi:hypothetical protein